MRHVSKKRKSEPRKVTNIKCNCGEWSGEACSWSGTKADTVRVEFMPERAALVVHLAYRRPSASFAVPVDP